MNTIDFSQNGGYRLKQATFARMQEAYTEILISFIKVMGIPQTGNHIITGCEIDGGNITSGFMYIDGELCPFSQAEGTLATKIKKNILVESIAFKNGSNLPVWRTTTAIVDPDGIPLSEFIRHNIVIDNNYVHTDNNFTATLLAKLNAIEAGAEVNVQPDWTVVNPASDAYIKNKPIIENIIYSGEYILGDFPNALTQRKTIPFPVPMTTTNYKVRAILKSLNPIGAQGADLISWTTANYQLNSFDIIGGEFPQFGATTQNLIMYYDIIKL